MAREILGKRGRGGEGSGSICNCSLLVLFGDGPTSSHKLAVLICGETDASLNFFQNRETRRL